MRAGLFSVLWSLLLALPWPLGAANVPAGTRLILAHFKGDGGGGDERLYISTSPDGLQWTALNGGNPVWQPPGWNPFGNVVRDPTIIYDQGYYWVAYTSGTYGHHASFGLVRSSNLIDWTFVGEISTLLPGTTDPLTWNPCFFRDSDGSVHLFVSYSGVNGSSFFSTSLRSYEMHPLNALWTQWSTPALIELPSTNTNEFWAWKEADGYHAVYVDFRNGGQVTLATSPALLTGWTVQRVLGWGGQEGAFVLRKPSGGYRLYLESGNNGENGDPTATYRIADYDAAFGGNPTQLRVQSSIPMRNGKPTIAPEADTYPAWANVQMGGPATGLRAELSDFDADGLLNAVEYAIGSSPGAASPAGLTVQHLGTQRRISYGLAGGRQDATVALEWADAPGAWQAAAGTLDLRAVTLRSDGTQEFVWDDSSTSLRRFYRLAVTVSP